MIAKERNALNLLIAYAIITFILQFFTYLPYGTDGFFQFLGSALALCAIYYPNYIYFNKRKHLFIN